MFKVIESIYILFNWWLTLTLVSKMSRYTQAISFAANTFKITISISRTFPWIQSWIIWYLEDRMVSLPLHQNYLILTNLSNEYCCKFCLVNLNVQDTNIHLVLYMRLEICSDNSSKEHTCHIWVQTIHWHNCILQASNETLSFKIKNSNNNAITRLPDHMIHE